ncbi:L-rhamnose mutarotase [Marinobacter lutaoensis]|uniref:L-rhamnose mutarotase n=1 Tax=Marinobacter lutaoensis TaxID=135739 RepID=A0A1V2DSM8_9GAMM|nr:L-rhamnose mutarotase [Marinobacter lutaoensis]ONF43426.1 L-rhamnose mutarotase [Marinobacter lutaoensis]
MQIRAFRMSLNPGQEVEYQRRHAEIWPDLAELLKASGIRWYRIFLDREHHALFALMFLEDEHQVDCLPEQAIMQKWWEYMADLMPANADKSPVSVDLEEMFSLYPQVMP